jgi:hypothetical protein
MSTKILTAFLKSIEDTEAGCRVDPEQFNAIVAGLEFARVAAMGGSTQYKGFAYNRLRLAAERVAEAVGPEPTEECPD